MTWRTTIYGLSVQADRALHAAPTELWTHAADVSLTHEQHEVPSHGPGDGVITMHYAPGGEDLYYCEQRADGTYLLVFVDACEFEVSEDLTQAVVRRHRGATPGIESVLTLGGFLAWQLYQRGHLVLHASAVEVGGGAIAFTGNSGMGKSTMATLMCAAGARMLADDVLRIDSVDAQPVARRGSSELRLRKGADTLAAAFDGASPDRRQSADDRQVLRPADQAGDRLPLRALFIPLPTRDSDEIRIDRISPVDAVFLLLRFPRLLGWQDERVRTAQFALMSAVAASVPLSLIHVPWGPPFSAGIAPAIRAELELERQGRRLQLGVPA
ncbi:hypothetical protein GCM10022288_22220 [Gryllotalpicola kribbensis]|uniref:HPr kinase/phosphorylase C-terminal domain-containing protein n=1 Tax=Gryllotalpicola kribbensis TaxID=993084 RepID=A0ABP8AW04_9MICO